MLSNFHSSRATRQRGQGNAFDDTLNNSEDTVALQFERQVVAIPDELALITDETSLTYRALDLEASRVAAVLTSLPYPHDRPIVPFIKDEANSNPTDAGRLEGWSNFHSGYAERAGELDSSNHRRLWSRTNHRRQVYSFDSRTCD